MDQTEEEYIQTVFPFSTVESTDLEAEFTYGSPLKHPYRNYITSLFIRKLRLLGLRWRSTTAAPSDPNHILSLPMDVIVQVFSHVHQLDLYHLCFTCKTFRQFLLNRDPVSGRGARRIWNLSFHMYREMPRVPAHWDASRWVHFFFGPPICETCGTPGAQVSFGILKKYCDNCADKLFITEPQAQELCASHAHSIRRFGKVERLCTRSGRRSLNHYGPKAYTKRVYLREEFERAIFIACPDCYSKPDRESTEAWKLVKEDAAANATRATAHGSKIDKWVDQWFLVHRRELVKWYQEWHMWKRYSRELEKQGFSEADASSAIFKVGQCLVELSESERGLSRRHYQYHLQLLIKIADNAREERLLAEAKVRVEQACREYQKLLTPAEWKYLPLGIICDVDSDLFKSLSTIPVTPVLSTKLSEWRQDIRTQLLDKLTSDPPESASPVLSLDRQALDLAVNVFTCKTCEGYDIDSGVALVGWDNILTHICNTTSGEHGVEHIEVWESGCETVQQLLDLLGMDLATTTAEAMDELDPRFFCDACTWERGSSEGVLVMKHAMSWRECLVHARYHECNPPYDNSYLLLGEASTNLVKAQEKDKKYPPLNYHLWACAHCIESADSLADYAYLEEHIRYEHPAIQTARCGVDIIYLPNRVDEYHTWHVEPFAYQVEPAWTYRCLKCPGQANQPTAFPGTLGGLSVHIARRHRSVVVQGSPVEGEDWEKIQVTVSRLGS